MGSTLVVTLAVGVASVVGILFLLGGGNSKKKFKRYRPNREDELSDFSGVKRVTHPRDVQEIRRSQSGLASAEPETIIQMFRKCRNKHGSQLAIVHEDMKGNERRWSWNEYYNEAASVAKSLIALGQKPQEITNCIGFNSPEWFFIDLGSMLAAGIPAGVYTTSNAGAMAYIANHSKAKVIFMESEKYLKRYQEVADSLNFASFMVVWSDVSESKLADYQSSFRAKLLTWQQFLSKGDDIDDDVLERTMDSVVPGNVSSLIYTSGTTGNPKAVMCSHDGMVFEARAMYDTSNRAGYDLGGDDFRMVSYLPLNHAAAKVADIMLPMVFTADDERGFHGEVWIARPDALKGTIVKTMQKARPTLFFGVPRVWEKFAEKMKAAAKKTPWPLSALSGYGKGLGREWYRNMFVDGSGKVPLLWPLFNKTLFKLVRKKLGLHETKQFATGAAPIQADTLTYFGSIGIPIINLYGMSENNGAATINYLNNYDFGSAGYPMSGIDIKIDHNPSRDKPGHGEILIGGRVNMCGYMYDPDKTTSTINPEGYVCSGDIGEMRNGCLHITGRIKELIIGAGGENIAPVPIEHYIKSIRTGISNIVMIGDKRKYNTALISLKTDVDPDTQIPSSALAGDAKDVSKASTTVEEAMNDPVWQKYLQSALDDYNNNGDVCVSRASKIQYFKILPTDLNIPDGTLGPTMKVKRPVVHKLYHDVIESMYTR